MVMEVQQHSSATTPSSPEAPSGSRGSSVSTSLREEYEDLLRYAVVTPVLDGRVTGQRTATPMQQQKPGVVSAKGGAQWV